ncbi:MAG: hypothetical protein V1872_13750 [bacterium]
MKEYMVSLDIITSLSTTSQSMSELLGSRCSMLECTEIDHGSLWRLESNLDEKVSLKAHVESIIAMIPSGISVKSNDFIKELYLVIGVLYYSATCTVTFPFECISLLISKFPGINIEIICYPCSEELDDEKK